MILLQGMRIFKHFIRSVFACAAVFVPCSAFAGGVIDMLDLSPFIPTILDVLLGIAGSTYSYFVGENGTGPLFVLIWGGTAISMGLYLVKLYLPKTWSSVFGFTGGGQMMGGMDGMAIVKNVLKPGFRAVIAVVLLLQLRPGVVVDVLVNPFLELGGIYSEAVIKNVNATASSASFVSCPPSVLEQGWLSSRSCKFLIEPVGLITRENNKMIKRGMADISNGLRGLITLIPRDGQNFMDIITGLILVFTFVSSNVFMAMLIIQGIFNFGMSLIFYPFQVLTYVFKESDKWFDVWPAFAGIIKALQELVITMIACSFILVINIAAVGALFPFGTSEYVAAAGGSATGNVPRLTTGVQMFGQHSITILSSILTFYLMFKIFEMTKEQLQKYTKGMDGMYKQVVSDAKGAFGIAKNGYGWGKNLIKKIRKK